MGKNDFKMIEVNLNEYAKQKPDIHSDFTYNQQKANDYTVKYVADQEEWMWDETYAKYPYFRFRGKPVSTEVALDIISKIDIVFKDVNDDIACGCSGNIDLFNDWTGVKSIHRRGGWVHPDGTVGYNGMTTKNPDCSELLNEIIKIKLDFPFLEFMVAFSYWSGAPEYDYEARMKIRDTQGEDAEADWAARENYHDFADNIELLIYTHGKTFEVYWNQPACEMYKELLPILQNKPDLKYVNQYYNKFWQKEENINAEDDIFNKCLISLNEMEAYRMHNHVSTCWGILKRKPFFRMIGKSVSKEQAFDFIRRTDEVFLKEFRYHKYLNIKTCDEFKYILDKGWIANETISTSWYCSNYGLVRPDGVIAYEYFTASKKYPVFDDFIRDFRNYATAFPYLDFVAAITCWNEMSPFEWNWDDYIDDIEKGIKTEEEVNDLKEVEDNIYNSIVFTVWVHGGHVDVFKGQEAVDKLKEYENLYGQDVDYYHGGQSFVEMGITKQEYFKKMLHLYGLPEEAMNDISGYQLRY